MGISAGVAFAQSGTEKGISVQPGRGFSVKPTKNAVTLETKSTASEEMGQPPYGNWNRRACGTNYEDCGATIRRVG